MQRSSSETLGEVAITANMETVVTDKGRWNHAHPCLDEESGRSRRSRSDDRDPSKPLDRLIL